MAPVVLRLHRSPRWSVTEFQLISPEKRNSRSERDWLIKALDWTPGREIAQLCYRRPPWRRNRTVGACRLQNPSFFTRSVKGLSELAAAEKNCVSISRICAELKGTCLRCSISLSWVRLQAFLRQSAIIRAFW